jgi:hypothetical protein
MVCSKSSKQACALVLFSSDACGLGQQQSLLLTGGCVISKSSCRALDGRGRREDDKHA